MYWSGGELGSDEVKRTMTHKRFCQINSVSCLHSRENAQETGEGDRTSPNYDSNYKILPCLKALLLACQENYNPSVSLAIDEQILAYKVDNNYYYFY